MKKIELEDNQGVVLQYATANSAERLASWFLDYISLGILLFVLAILLQLMHASEGIIMGSTTTLFFTYSLLLERLTGGRSIGKAIMGLRVVRLDGEELQFDDSFQRWIMRLIDGFFSLSAIAILSIEGSPRAQRLGDILADTTVVKAKNLRLSLLSLKSLDQLQEAPAKYPQASQLAEEQVLFIREALRRFQRKPNQSKKELVETLAQRIRLQLAIDDATREVPMLEQLVKDYVRLTR